jgi:hypothetical protein
MSLKSLVRMVFSFCWHNIFLIDGQILQKRFYNEKKESDNDYLKARAARLSRKATSLALRCSLSKPLLDELEKSLDKLELEEDDSLIKIQESEVEIPLVSDDCGTSTENGTISFKVPERPKE